MITTIRRPALRLPTPLQVYPPGQAPAPTARATHTVTCWFNPAAFETPAEQGNGSFGYGRRNTLFGPKLSDVNLSLAKTWHYKERAGLTLTRRLC